MASRPRTLGLVAWGLTADTLRQCRNWLLVQGTVPLGRVPVLAFELLWRACYGEWWEDA